MIFPQTSHFDDLQKQKGKRLPCGVFPLRRLFHLLFFSLNPLRERFSSRTNVIRLRRKGKKYVATRYSTSADDDAAVPAHCEKRSRKANSIGPTPATFGSAFVMSSISEASSCVCQNVSAVQPARRSAR